MSAFAHELPDDFAGPLRQAFIGVQKENPTLATLVNHEVPRAVEIRNVRVINDVIDIGSRELHRAVGAAHVDQIEYVDVWPQRLQALDNIKFLVKGEDATSDHWKPPSNPVA